MTNEIQVDEKGNCTVIGSMAHSLWKAGGFPRSRCSTNNFYVYGYNELPQGWRWEVEGWGPYKHEIELGPNQVLVDVKNAPYLGQAPNDGTMPRRQTERKHE
jgi:hypothetical protein